MLIWVAGGYGSAPTGNMAYSLDGINWRTGQKLFFTKCTAVAYNGSIWVAAGDTNTNSGANIPPIAYSDNGIDWSGIGTIPDMSFIYASSGKHLVWNGTMFLLSGPSSYMTYSYDGINWHKGGSTAAAIAWNGSEWIGITRGNPPYGYGTIIKSTDGINWTDVTYTSNIATQIVTCSKLIWSNVLRMWVAVGKITDMTTGYTHNIATSTDGIAWTFHRTETYFETECTNIEEGSSVLYGNIFIAGGTSAPGYLSAASTVDPSSGVWTPGGPPFGAYTYGNSLTGGGLWVSVGGVSYGPPRSDIAYSLVGTAGWTQTGFTFKTWTGAVSTDVSAICVACNSNYPTFNSSSSSYSSSSSQIKPSSSSSSSSHSSNSSSSSSSYSSQSEPTSPGHWSAQAVTLDPTSSHMKAVWKLEETSGTRYDSMGTNNLININTPTAVAGKSGNGAGLSSANGFYAPTGWDMQATTGITLSTWVKFKSQPPSGYSGPTLGTGRCSISYLGPTEYYPTTNLLTARVAVKYPNGISGVFVNAPMSLTLNMWYLLTITAAIGERLKFYVNGFFVGDSGIYGVVPDGGIVYSTREAYNTFAGDINIDETYFWKNYALSDAQVAALYNGGTGSFWVPD
jgi:hypothetical protein